MISLAIKIYLYVFVMFMMQIVIHETGHFIFGKLTGYQFLSFRIFTMVILKVGQCYTIRRCRSPGSYGQCLLKPPDRKNCPFVWLTLGGIIFNLITAIIAVIFIFGQFHIPFVHIMGLIIFSFYGLSFAVINILPIKNWGITNDGLVFLDLLRDPCARDCYKRQLELLPDLLNGKTYGELPYDLLKVPEDYDLTNSLIGYHKILECYHFMDLRDWTAAKDCLEDFYRCLEHVPKMIRNIVLSEDLFIRIKLGDTTVRDSGIYETVRNYLKKGNGDYHTTRVCIAYDIYRNPDHRNEEKIKKELHRLRKDYLFQGEARFCDSLIKELI